MASFPVRLEDSKYDRLFPPNLSPADRSEAINNLIDQYLPKWQFVIKGMTQSQGKEVINKMIEKIPSYVAPVEKVFPFNLMEAEYDSVFAPNITAKTRANEIQFLLDNNFKGWESMSEKAIIDMINKERRYPPTPIVNTKPIVNAPAQPQGMHFDMNRSTLKAERAVKRQAEAIAQQAAAQALARQEAQEARARQVAEEDYQAGIEDIKIDNFYANLGYYSTQNMINQFNSWICDDSDTIPERIKRAILLKSNRKNRSDLAQTFTTKAEQCGFVYLVESYVNRPKSWLEESRELLADKLKTNLD
jgi:hypothetical protein